MANELKNLFYFIWNWDREVNPSLNNTYNFKSFIEEKSKKYGNGPALTISNSKFVDLLEPEVRRLVEIIVNKAGLITFSSCEGHDGSERYVSILPRSRSEYRTCWMILLIARGIVETRVLSDEIQIDIARDSVTDGSLEVPTIKLQFLLKDSNNSKEELDKVYQIFCETLEIII